MSISKVFFTLIGNKNTIFKNAEFYPDHIIFRARLQKNIKRCSHCNSLDIRIKETKERTFRMLNLGQKRTQLKIDNHKIWCQKCDNKSWIKLPFVYGKIPMTKTFVFV